MLLDPSACYEALLARDARFDGVFFVGVKTTGIYCRPVCRARTPGKDRCVFFHHAAEAEREGFRACFRCRPERAPGSGFDARVSQTVAAACARIEAGALGEQSVDELASELGVTGRHLRRCMQQELGVSPIELATTRRLALSRELLHGTALSITDVAFASGFQSVRRFNSAFLALHGRSPKGLRTQPRKVPDASALTLTLDYRPPYDWEAVLEFLTARAVTGVEHATSDSYSRTVRVGDRRGWIRVRHGKRHAVMLEVSPSLVHDLLAVVAKVRRLFDLDARPLAIRDHLSRDPELAPLLERRPGLRVPGAFEPFETAMAAVLGQQVTVRAGVTLASRLVARLGEDVATPFPALTRIWPTPTRLASAPDDALAAFGMPTGRVRTLVAVARAIAEGHVHLDHPASPEALRRELLALRGIGPWTAEYVLMRAAAWPDAFPEKDVALAKALGIAASKTTADVAEAWRPWRSYATLHLWTKLGDAP